MLTDRGAGVTRLEVDRSVNAGAHVVVTLDLTGHSAPSELVSAVAQLDGVLAVGARDQAET